MAAVPERAESIGRALRGERRFGHPRRDRRLALYLMIPSLVIPAFFTLVFLVGVAMSFTRWRMTTGYSGIIGLQNYIDNLQDYQFWNAVMRTFEFSILDLTSELLIGTLIALALHRQLRGTKIFRTILILPLMTPPVVGALIWKVIMRSNTSGLVNLFLVQVLHIPAQGLLGTPSQALACLVVIDIWLNMPFVATILLTGMQSLPQDPFESAKMDGANGWQTFRNVMLPLLVPFYTVALFFRGIDSLNAFDTIYAATAGGPGISTRVMPFAAYENSFPWLNLSFGISIVLMLWIFCVIFGRLLYGWIKSAEGPQEVG